MTILGWTLWLVTIHTVTGRFAPKTPDTTIPCNGSFELTMLPWLNKDLPASDFKKLAHCVQQLYGCSEDLINCGVNVNLVASAHNCRKYGDCCRNVSVSYTSGTQTSRTSCVEVQVSSTKEIQVNMITGCSVTWPNDDIRHACERPESFADTFYIVPTTRIGGVTYRNGFCAWGNNDIVNATFWRVAQYEADRGVHNLPPEVANVVAWAIWYDMIHIKNGANNEGQERKETDSGTVTSSPSLRPCNQTIAVNPCPKNVTKAVSLKCKAYYAPVRDAKNPDSPVCENAYCALCNAVKVSLLSRSPPTHAPSLLHRTLKPVIRTLQCYANYGGRCCIRCSPDDFIARESSELHQDIAASDAPMELHSPLGYRPKWQSKHSIEHYVVFICTNLSILFLVLKIVVFCVYKEARRSSSVCITCLVVTLLVAQVLLLVTKCANLAKYFCFTGAVLAHYFFLSTFLWTCVLSYDIWKSLTTTKTSSSGGRRLTLYCLLAWGVPLLVVSAALTVNQVAPGSVLSPRYGHPICFIGSFFGLMLYFFVPMAALVLFCHILYFKTVRYIRKTSSAAVCADSTRQPVCKDSRRHGQQRINLALFVRLSFIMGAPWVVALAGSFVNSLIIDSVVNGLVGLQGVYLFFGFKDYRYISLSLRKRTTKPAAVVNA